MASEGTVALVTGAARGIGRGIALRLARDGAAVIVADLADHPDAEQTMAELRSAGADAVYVPTDVSRVAEARGLVNAGVEAFGRIDVLVNNAGVQRHAAFLDAEEDDYDLVLGVNLKGPFFLAQAFARHVRERGGGGRIVNISSVHEELPFPNFASYCASKGGLKMLTRDLAVELAPLDITVNNIAPGAIRTSINDSLLDDPAKLQALRDDIPAGRMGTPEEVAEAVSFAISPGAAYLTGSTITVDGGLMWNYREQ
ncbi:SDR family NAD(P)-dependent oxidoreductase [Agromyces subbeticus]|uniref:SDR family NAD(P)-dependent oxidoreductase n=1 Tax=Agromyces subbeticus TaxID=293890 RepID=UPI0003B592E8|nr:glucose 1-dehydrogenase [Agromyces subbeticus]